MTEEVQELLSPWMRKRLIPEKSRPEKFERNRRSRRKESKGPAMNRHERPLTLVSLILPAGSLSDHWV
jgi:hypothetical protein